MKIGLFGINVGPLARPEALAAVARHAEECGIESLWTGEHVVLPDPQVPPSPAPPESEMLDPAVALTWAAAATTRIRLGTGIIILPQRNPVVLAKELASVDVLSGGRLIFGIGVGYLEPEFRAIGASFERKGARTREYLAAMRELWASESPAFDGEFVRFADIQQRPRPAQKSIPIVFGGHSGAAYRRAVGLADGWYGFALDVAQTRRNLEGLRDAAAVVARPAQYGRLEITVTPPPGTPLDAALAAEYRDAGVDRLVPMVLGASAEQIQRGIDSLSPLID